MQFIKRTLGISFLLTPIFNFAQTTYLPQQSRHSQLLDRLEIKTAGAIEMPFTTAKPLDRRYAMKLGLKADSMTRFQPLFFSDSTPLKLSKTDWYNLRSLYMNNQEWYPGDRSAFRSKKPLGKSFYQSPANLVEHFGKDFFIAVNPVVSYRQSVELNNTDQTIFINQRGLTVRGGIDEKVGFSASVVETQERGPLFFQDFVNRLDAVPGANFYKRFKVTGVDFIDARGSFTFSATRNIQLQLGYDRNFIGNGYRSMFLSDFGGNNLFVKVNTRIWKFNYQNLFMELHKGAANNNNNNLVPKKYATMHHLSMNVTKWLNVGLFEGVVFGRTNRFEFGYMNPVIFFRAIEGNLGSRDNAVVGADFKANAMKTFQVYGQLLIDEFSFSKLRDDNSWWGNKTAMQLGVKYIDALNIRNLDLQLEWNRIRPFTYSHFDSVSNYSHYNQPLAHPLGANLNEVVAIARYQPTGRLNFTGKIIYWKQGLDSASGRNAGANIFRTSSDGRSSEFGYRTLNGVLSTGINASLLASYELKENIFADAYILMRQFKPGSNAPAQNTTMIGLGLRMNLWAREYDY